MLLKHQLLQALLKQDDVLLVHFIVIVLARDRSQEVVVLQFLQQDENVVLLATDGAKLVGGVFEITEKWLTADSAVWRGGA